jgi:hypothetical protein
VVLLLVTMFCPLTSEHCVQLSLDNRGNLRIRREKLFLSTSLFWNDSWMLDVVNTGRKSIL